MDRLRHAPLAALLLLGCRAAPPPPPPEPLDVVAASHVAAWLAARVAGADARVTDLQPDGTDPPFWQPPPELLVRAASADLIVANGAGFETWLATSDLPRSRLAATADGLELLHLPGQTHRHGAAGEHTHAGIDPHTWLDPLQYAAQAAVLSSALAAKRPEAAPRFGAAAAALAAELAAVDARWQEVLAPARALRLAANHPAYGYLARRYGLSVRAFAFDPDEPPSAEERAAFAAFQAEGPVDGLLWESEPAAEVADAFPGVAHLVLDPLESGHDGAAYDYLAQARAAQDAFAAFVAARAAATP